MMTPAQVDAIRAHVEAMLKMAPPLTPEQVTAAARIVSQARGGDRT